MSIIIGNMMIYYWFFTRLVKNRHFIYSQKLPRFRRTQKFNTKVCQWIPISSQPVIVNTSIFRQVLSDVFEKLRKAIISFVISVRPSVRLKQLDSHLNISRTSVGKIQVSLKSDNNNGYITWRPRYFLTIPLSVHLRMRSVSDKICRGNQNRHFIFRNVSSKIVRFMWKKFVHADMPQMTIWACILRAGCLRLQTHTQDM
jgi:hypothetical protein